MSKRNLVPSWPALPVLGIGALYVIVACSAFVAAPSMGAEDWPLKHDMVGYYAYLPALLTEGGLGFESMTGPRWDRFVEGGFAGFYRHPESGRLIDAFTPGVAVLQAPFFALGHLIARAGGFTPDGFSAPYRLLAALGGAVYATLGLLVLFSVLRTLFTVRIALGAVVILGLGTNLFYYATLEGLMTHAYSFFALSVLLWATMSWARSPRLLFAVLGGMALGIAVMVRPTNAVVALLPVGYLGARWLLDGEPAERRPPWGHLLAAGFTALACTLPLLAYWRFASGSWITNPHGVGTFYFEDPRIGGVLWSFRKGWFVYAPAMLAVIPGLALLFERVPRITVPLLAYAAAAVYVASSYWSWWYGGSFGMRALIEVSAPLSLALAAFLTWSCAGRRGRRATVTIFGLLIALNVFQTYQYVRGYIHWDGMTGATYRAVFLRPSIPEREMQEIRRALDQSDSRRPKEM